jgi:molybdenum cofactor cytidylyltransferase
VNVAGIILAAGASTRFKDGHKLLAHIDGLPIVRRVALVLAQSRLGEIVLVTAADSATVANAAGFGRWRTLENPNAGHGLSSSLRLGLQSIGEKAGGMLVALADMPGVRAELINSLLEAFEETGGRSIVFPLAADGRRGHPIIWPKELFSELSALSGDTGGREILALHRELWCPVPCEDAGAFADIDTHEDLAAFGQADLQPTRRK